MFRHNFIQPDSPSFNKEKLPIRLFPEDLFNRDLAVDSIKKIENEPTEKIENQWFG